jgi:hypothetical protein
MLQKKKKKKEREKNETAATYALEAATTALAQCSVECKQLLLLDNGQNKGKVNTVMSSNSGTNKSGVVRGKIERLDDSDAVYDRQRRSYGADNRSILGASISMSELQEELQATSDEEEEGVTVEEENEESKAKVRAGVTTGADVTTGFVNESTGGRGGQLTPPRMKQPSSHGVVQNRRAPIHDMVIHSMFTSPTREVRRGDNLHMREKKQREVCKKSKLINY